MFSVTRSFACFFTLLFLLLSAQAQRTQVKSSGPRRLAFAPAQKLLEGESEGNLHKLANANQITYTRTRLSTGQVLELYYPVSANQPAGKKRAAIAPGYGVLYESEAAYLDAIRPRHALEGLINDANEFVARVPQLVARLEKRLRLGAGKLDYSRSSLRRLDAYIAAYQREHTTAETNAELFQELTAYYGETLRRALAGEWQIGAEKVGKTHVQSEPNLALRPAGSVRTQIVKPWSSVHSALYNEDRRGAGLTSVFDADVAAAR